MMASRACPPSLTGSWPRRPATPTSQRLGPLQGMPDARPITLIRIGPRGAAGERSLLPHFQVRFCSINRHSSMPLQCLKCANGLNRSRGRALRRAAWPCQQWMERWSVLPDDEGPEARPQNRTIVQHDDRAIYHRRRWERTDRSETTSASRMFRIPEPMRLEMQS